jgi:aspartate/methionine/tyrosine aminotransferase
VKPLSSAVSAMPRSAIREFMELASQLDDVIHLEAGEPDFTTPDAIIRAGFEAAQGGFTKYTANAGLPSLRAAIAAKVRQQNGLEVGAEHIVVTPGSVAALTTAVLAIVNAGDEVLVPDPGWPNYVNIVLLAGARPVSYTLLRENRYLPDIGELEALISPRTKLLMLNNPCNPTGVVFPGDVVKALAAFARRHDLYVLSDEIYEFFVFDGIHEPIAQFDSEGRVVTVYGFSKTYAMTGWRLGYAVAPPSIVQLIMRLQEPLVSCASTISQKAAEAALKLPSDVTSAMRDAYRARRDVLVAHEGTRDLVAIIPQGAFYALLDLERISADSYALAHQLLREERVATAPGETFGPSSAGMLRVAFTTELEKLEEGCRRIGRYVRRHGNERRAIRPDPPGVTSRYAPMPGRSSPTAQSPVMPW